MSDYKVLTFLRRNMMDDAEEYPAEICISDGSGKAHIQKVSKRSLVNLMRDSMKILVEAKFFETGEKNDDEA